MSSHRGSYRGNWRGNRGAYQSNSNYGTQIAPSKPLGASIDNISIKTLLIENESPTIQQSEYVASYNWVDVKSPVIIVPGSPPAWTPPVINPQLKQDSEPVFRDINAARFPSYPLEPMIRSTYAMNPNLDFRALDIIGCGSTLGNILRFAGSQSKPFRFDVDLIGGTVFFVRKGESPMELITDLRGYGHTFPEAYTTWDAEVSNSCSHQRILRYEFGGLHLLVRSETDGYIKNPDPKPLSDDFDSMKSSQDNMVNLEKGITDMFTVTDSDNTGSKLQMKLSPADLKVPQSQIFDIKTRASNRTFDMNEILPRLWVSQTPRFLIAYHHFGLFDEPEIKDVKRDVAEWEKSNASLLGRFHAVLKRIVDVVRDSEEMQCEVSWDGVGSLCVTEKVAEVSRVVPSDLRLLWEGEEEKRRLVDVVKQHKKTISDIGTAEKF